MLGERPVSPGAERTMGCGYQFGGFPCAPLQVCAWTSSIHLPHPCRWRRLSPPPPLGSHSAPKGSGWGLGALGLEVGAPTTWDLLHPGLRRGQDRCRGYWGHVGSRDR